MPSLQAIYPEMSQALARWSGGAPRPRLDLRAGRDFAAIIAALFSRTFSETEAGKVAESLRDRGLETPEDVASADLTELVEATRGRPGSSKPLAPRAMQPLQRLARWIVSRGGLESLADAATEDLRDALRAIPGIGPAAADAVLLAGWGRPSYPVDRASYRILARHGWIDPTTDYEEARAVVEALEPGNAAGLTALAADFAAIGRKYCRATVAKCKECPLSPFLPDGGPYEPGFDG